ncbi:MAG: putative type-2 restriction enzyme MthZI [Methanobrevibacter sp. CfCl-M3]
MSKNDKFEGYELIKLEKAEIIEDIVDDFFDFPKYTTQLLNLANQNAQGTRPKVVGQMSELIKQIPEKSFETWKQYYMENYSDNIKKATEIIYPMVKNLEKAIGMIDKEMVEHWVKDLILVKTAEGLIFQEAILKYLAEEQKIDWRLSSPQEESKGIDGFIGDKPVSIKPISYSGKDSLMEKISVEIIFYEKSGKHLKIYRQPYI